VCKIVFLAGLFCLTALAQQTQQRTSVFGDYYPISIKPTVRYLSSMVEQEEILFDANPVVYYSFYNNMVKNLQDVNDKRFSSTFYASFQPHIRMYNENSRPVKTPSYRVFLGFQLLRKTDENHFVAAAIESGHYSNGQSGCAFDTNLDDETSPCDAVYAAITDQTNLSDILNRVNGNFSTNFTRVSGNFRLNNLKKNTPYQVHSFTGWYELWHNNMFFVADIGGYNPLDIDIYGRHRMGFEYEYLHTYKETLKYSVGFRLQGISGAHPSVEPLRTEVFGTWYPFKSDFGFFVSYIYGHDNYNYRFVDSGNQVSVGVSWDWFTPFEIKRAEALVSEQ
jgi:hypothetical protein